MPEGVLIAARKRTIFAAEDSEHCRVGQVCNRHLDAAACSFGVEPRNGTTETITEIDCSCKQALVRSDRIEVEMIPCRSAPKAPIDVPPEIGRKAPALGRRRAMHRAATPNLVTGSLVRDEAQQFQYLSHGHERTHFLKAHAGHGSNTATTRTKESLIGTNTATEKRSP